jgi:hypothetical protein
MQMHKCKPNTWGVTKNLCNPDVLELFECTLGGFDIPEELVQR